MKKFGMSAKFLAVPLALMGCSTPSKDITPVQVSPLQYAAYDCEQIAGEQRRIHQRAGEVGARLDQAASNDKVLAWSSLLVWPTLFFLGGTKKQEAEYARLRGEYEALHQAAVLRKCPGALAPMQQAAPSSKPGDASAGSSTAPAIDPMSK